MSDCINAENIQYPLGSIYRLSTEIDLIQTVEFLGSKKLSRLCLHRGVYFQVKDVDMNDIAGFMIFRNQEISSNKLSRWVPCNVTIDLSRNVPKEFEDPVLAHEVSEAFYALSGLAVNDAHAKALIDERAYVYKHMNPSKWESFFQWSESVRL